MVGFSSSLPVVGFAGSRSLSAAVAGPLVSALVGSALAAGRAVAAGCALGADSLALSAAVAFGAGRSVRAAGFQSRLFVFCAFGPAGLGVGRSSSLAGVSAAAAAGARVAWWAGGGPAVPPAARLAGRSLAFVRFLAASPPGSALVAFVSGPPPRAFGRAAPGGWPSCGSGSWGSVGAAALLGLPVVVFPVGWAGFAGAASLPPLPGRGPAGRGRWVAAGGRWPWAAGFRWVV